MSDETRFTVNLHQRDYDVEIDDGRAGVNKGHFLVVDRALNIAVADRVGNCNPLTAFWCSAISAIDGEDRAKKINQLIECAVEDALQDLNAFRAELIDSGEPVPEDMQKALEAAGL